MKKHLLLSACLLISVCSLRAQQPDTANTMVHYKFSHLRDTTKPENVYTENMMLLLGNKSTVYKSYDARLAALDAKRQIQEQMAANGGNGPIRVNQKNGGSGTQYYLFPDENKLVRKEKLINSYLIDEPFPVINWQISTDTASFGGFHCQKATAHFRGRDYTAWFCPDISFHGGPWKLSGLPGLILEAYDAKKQVVFKFDGMEDISKMTAPAKTANDMPQPPGGVKLFGMDDLDQDPRLIVLPTDAIKTTEPEFAKLKEAMHKDPNAFLQSAMAGSGANMSPNGPQMRMDIKLGPQAVVNNPIELPEKK
jgi:GLPGLI family protein